FHHLLKGVHGGARLYAIDPRRSESARWADVWLGIDVGSDIALANAMAKVIIDEGLQRTEFIDRATTGFDDYAATVAEYDLERATEITGIPGEVIREMAIAYATAETAQICWTLGITEHHNATDNVLALISLALLTGHVGRYGSGLVPIRGQNNVQGGGDMGALPNKLPGFQDIENDEHRGKFEAEYGVELPAKRGWHLTQMFEAMDAGTLRGLYVIGENPAQSEADVTHVREAIEGLDFLVVQDIFLTRTAEMADVVFPAAADWCEAEGTVTSSERRVQRIRKALEPPGSARTDIDILSALAAEMGRNWGRPTAEEVWDEVRKLSPPHAGMSYRRLDEHGGIQWPCWDEDHPGSQFLHDRLWEERVADPAPFVPVEWVAPVDTLTDE
ncbi:MAG: molybdopterin-dependent oxidoreductase, partial [Acidimicrobiia bacterium]|nr:molybdopterin-dependent oxidoreductase [Acidimicrobiia bacterium]